MNNQQMFDKLIGTSASRAFNSAVCNGDLQVVELMLRGGRVDPSADNNLAFRKAAHNCHSKVVDRLLRDGRVDPSADDNFAIRTAASNDYKSVVERLLRDGRVDPSARGNEAIRMAAIRGYFSVVERLLRDGRVAMGAAVIFPFVRPHQFHPGALLSLCVVGDDVGFPAAAAADEAWLVAIRQCRRSLHVMLLTERGTTAVGAAAAGLARHVHRDVLACVVGEFLGGAAMRRHLWLARSAVDDL